MDNRHGLSRNIPADVKRTVRQRDGFGCVVCGKAIYDYEHFDPEFADATQHDPAGIVLLCISCHGKKTRGFLSKQTIAAARQSPNRTELKDIWRRLLANAFDPVRSKWIRASFIEIAKKLDPLDALVLEKLQDGADGQLKPSSRDYVSTALGVPSVEVMLSFENLKALGLIWHQPHEVHHPMLTDKGRVFLAAAQA
ncbi:Abi-alpha family protein [Bradyrhizobium sp. AZCC 2230]|uniref:Abi-alpha family protein n=1 Tax=Bradyrhizobium sp. AZCC 2230 TaxID=3117021 RepID=UPI002FF1DC40